jgi:GT2 family glycosyltransferase
MAPQVTFITAFHNQLEHSQRMLAGFQSSVALENYEFLWVDDQSTDGSAEWVKTLSEPYSLLQNSRSRGFSGANNTAAFSAKGEWLVFLNNDLLFHQPWLEPMLTPLVNSEVGAVGNVQLNPATNLIDHAGMFFDQGGIPRQARKNTLRIPHGDYSEWNCLSAACLAIRKDLFLQLGGFDEEYRTGWEDADLCMRIRLQGKRLLLANRSLIYHIGGATEGSHLHNDANRTLFLQKWQSLTQQWAEKEWHREYLLRYSRHWWKLQPIKTLHALLSLHRCRE